MSDKKAATNRIPLLEQDEGIHGRSCRERATLSEEIERGIAEARAEISRSIRKALDAQED